MGVGTGAGAATGAARTGPGDGVGFTGVFARSGPPHELGAGLADWEERATTDVQPLPEELPGVGCATGAGNTLAEAGRDNGCSPGARRSASFPRPGEPDDPLPPLPPMEAERSGAGTRESMRRMSWTLRCGSWSTICVSMRYTVARSCTNLRFCSGICGSTWLFFSVARKSAKLFSTSAQNFALARANAVTSSVYVTCCSVRPPDSRSVGLMPSASARRALRFAIVHSLEHLSCWLLSRAPLERERPQGTDWRMRPQGQVMVTTERQGSDSSQEAGA